MRRASRRPLPFSSSEGSLPGTAKEPKGEGSSLMRSRRLGGTYESAREHSVTVLWELPHSESAECLVSARGGNKAPFWRRDTARPRAHAQPLRQWQAPRLSWGEGGGRVVPCVAASHHAAHEGPASTSQSVRLRAVPNVAIGGARSREADP